MKRKHRITGIRARIISICDHTQISCDHKSSRGAEIRDPARFKSIFRKSSGVGTSVKMRSSASVCFRLPEDVPPVLPSSPDEATPGGAPRMRRGWKLRLSGCRWLAARVGLVVSAVTRWRAVRVVRGQRRIALLARRGAGVDCRRRSGRECPAVGTSHNITHFVENGFR